MVYELPPVFIALNSEGLPKKKNFQWFMVMGRLRDFEARKLNNNTHFWSLVVKPL